MRLPEEYKVKMQRLLGDEYENYENSLAEPINTCLRVNTLKISVEDFLAISPFKLERVPWAPNAFYYDANIDSPSKHPFYYAGLYYLQEPSATLPAATIPIEEGDRVLDICAAPGGKSTELACKLAGSGLLISNDVSASRLKALQKNMEIFGIKNSIITCEEPVRLADALEGYFDKILVDAPCSGEGMFRKSGSMITAWEQNGNEKFCEIQRSILSQIVRMLKPGGTILYSTCTFDPREDEDQVMYMMSLRPDLKIIPINQYDGFITGKAEWSSYENADSSLSGTMHLFPHKVRGEGHFVSLLQSETNEGEYSSAIGYSFKSYSSGKRIPEIDEFLSHIISGLDSKNLELRNDKLFLIPEDSPALPGMRIMRRGVYLGELKKKRFEPSQSFAMILKNSDFDNVLDLNPDGISVYKYLRGETLDIDEVQSSNDNISDTSLLKDGWVLVSVSGYPLGFGKLSKGLVKNKYLSGWRMMS